jgi:hypothetical protein
MLKLRSLRFHIPKVVNIKTMVLWASCHKVSLVEVPNVSKELAASIFRVEDGSSMFLGWRRVGNQLPDYDCLIKVILKMSGRQ